MLVSADAVSLVRSNRALVDKVSVQVSAGEMVGLIGPNGAGKSTLMSMLAGLTTPSEGSVLLDGIPIDQVSVVERSRQLAWLEQTGPIHWPLTVERLVTLGRRPHLSSWHRPTQADRSAVDKAIRVTDCVHLRNQDATTLSGGERARVMLARALASEPRVLLADEPVSSLDIGHQLQTMDLLREYATENQGCMVVLHDLSLAARYCDRLYLLDHGKLVAEGLPTSVLTDDNLEKVYSVRVERDAALQGWILPISLV